MEEEKGKRKRGGSRLTIPLCKVSHEDPSGCLVFNQIAWFFWGSFSVQSHSFFFTPSSAAPFATSFSVCSSFFATFPDPFPRVETFTPPPLKRTNIVKIFNDPKTTGSTQRREALEGGGGNERGREKRGVGGKGVNAETGQEERGREGSQRGLYRSQTS